MFVVDDRYDDDILITTINNVLSVSRDVSDNINIYISYFGSVDRMKRLQNKLMSCVSEVDIKFKNIPAQYPDIDDTLSVHYSKTTHANQIPTSSVYYRFFISSTWPEIDGLLLYLDVDVLVKSSVSELFAQLTSLPETPIYSPQAITWNDVIEEKPIDSYKEIVTKFLEQDQQLMSSYLECQESGIDILNVPEYADEPAFNGGVWIYNLDLIRQGKYEHAMELCMKLQSKHKLFMHNDQGIMNVVFSKFGRLDRQWNALDYGWLEKTDLEYDAAKIVHFNGHTKPWILEKIWSDKPWVYKPAFAQWNKYRCDS